MFTAYIIGGGKRFTADTLDLLISKIEREGIRIHDPERLRAQNTLEHRREALIRGSRRLTTSQWLQKHLRNPYRHYDNTESIQIRIIKSKGA